MRDDVGSDRLDVVHGAGALRDAADAWRVIERFAAAWHEPLTAADGVAEAELVAAERRLGLRLPAAMRAAYRLFGRRAALTCAHDQLLAPAALHRDRTGEVLVFRHENQHVAEWGVPLATLGRPDPPVVMWTSMSDPAEERWEPFLPRFSLACVEMVLSESLLAPTGPLSERTAHAELDDAAVAVLERRFTPLTAIRYAMDSSTPWYLSRDVLLRREDGFVWALARTSDVADRWDQVLPADWQTGPP